LSFFSFDLLEIELNGKKDHIFLNSWQQSFGYFFELSLVWLPIFMCMMKVLVKKVRCLWFEPSPFPSIYLSKRKILGIFTSLDGGHGKSDKNSVIDWK